jgi:hypothetical protein
MGIAVVAAMLIVRGMERLQGRRRRLRWRLRLFSLVSVLQVSESVENDAWDEMK